MLFRSETVAVLRIAGIRQGLPAIFNSITQAMEVLRVGHSSWNNGRFPDRKGSISHFLEMNRERGVPETRQGGEEGPEEFLGPARADHSERRPRPSLVFRKDQGIEKVRDEVGEVIGVVVGEENVSDPMAVHAGLHEVRQRARAEVQQYRMVGADEITRGCSRRMDVRAGSQNRQTHELWVL